MSNITNILDFHSNHKPLIRFLTKVEGYYVRDDGEIWSTKSNKYLSGFVHTEVRTDGTRRPKEIMYSLTVPKNMFSDFERQAHKEGNTGKLPLAGHRAVMETWRPIDEYPPDEIADEWFEVITPEMVGQPRIPPKTRQWVRDTAAVDHIDDDPTHNHYTNLRWITPKRNQPNRKKAELSLLDNIETAENAGILEFICDEEDS
ncbi:hypothetical protein [Synechococcus phage S-RS29]|nr:hypothetical protein [Synechococcus phage S-RS29]